jgi:hypothetical protein
MGIGGDVLGLLIGIASSLVFLLLLFSVKPRLRLRWDQVAVSNSEAKSDSRPDCACDVHYRVAVENLGLGRVVEVEARLWLLTRRGDAPPTRQRICFEPDTLLELSGKWREACRTPHERDDLQVGDTLYRFRLPCQVSADALSGQNGYFLFQIWSKHGFTNFGRLHLIRIIARDGCLLDDNAFAQVRRRPNFAWAASVIAAIAGLATRARKHLHRFELQRAYLMKEPSGQDPRTVAPLLCACGQMDTRSVRGEKEDMGQILLKLQNSTDQP